MQMYKVMMLPMAEEDIMNNTDYIAFEKKAPDIVNGPYGTFDLYIRSNNVFTIVEVHVE